MSSESISNRSGVHGESLAGIEGGKACCRTDVSFAWYSLEMLTHEQLAGEIAINLVHAMCKVCMHSHKQGVDLLFVQGHSRPLAPLEARRRFAAILEHRRVRPFVTATISELCVRKPADIGPMSPSEVACAFEEVETYLWIGSIRTKFPSFTATTPVMWSKAGELARSPIELWWRRVRVREANDLHRANRIAAAWRWRAEVGALVLPLRNYRAPMRKYVTALRKLVPIAARFAGKKRWFVPERNDFPVGNCPRLNYTDNLSWEERQQLLCLARSRSHPLRRVLDVDGSLSPENDVGAGEAWCIMSGNDVLAEHPALPMQ